MSGVDYSKFLAEFNCTAGVLNRNGTDRNIMDEILSHTDETNKETQIHNYFRIEESSCCDVESGMNSSVQDSVVENCSSVPRSCDERTVGTDAYSAMDNSSKTQVGVSAEGKNITEENSGVRWATETLIKLEEGCVSGDSLSAEERIKIGIAEPIQETACSNANLQQLHVNESDDMVHFHIESGTLKNIESFNAFQYWRVPIQELELDIGLAETGAPIAVQVKAEVSGETMRQALTSELNVDMDIDVSSFEILSYTVKPLCDP